ncbi:MAG TPA: GNAT family N-acetyltransferase [Candidatus Limnocylindrales bacterium]|nr:GNAT family N-acetyltransferase [Candidatus Limnocylindrales bacterium]
MTDRAPLGDRVRVGRVPREWFDDAARLLARATADEAIISHALCADRATRVRALASLYRAWLAAFSPYAEIHSAMLDDRLVAVGVRLPPGNYPLRRRSLPRVLLRIIPGYLRMAMTCRGAMAMMRAGFANEPYQPRGRPYWYLNILGVEPEFQGRGIGKRMAHEVLERADAAGVGCYLETYGEGTKALYLKRGFVVFKEVRPFTDGPTCYLMWRDPRPPTEPADT